MPSRRFRATTRSTQAEAIAWAREGAEPGSRVVAREQSEGVGRLDHAWASPRGGLYLSIILADDPVGPIPLFPLTVGWRLREGLRARWGVEARVKWPNDLVVVRGRGPARKLVGILVDRVEPSSGGSRLVVGVGVNVGAPPEAFPAEVREAVVGLYDLTSSRPTLDEVEEVVTEAALDARRRLLEAPGDPALLDAYRGVLYGLGCRARVDGRPVGVVRGIGADGTLLVEESGHLEHVTAGSLTIEEAA